MTPGISGSVLSWLSFLGATMPPRDPNDDQDEEDEEDEEDGGDADDDAGRYSRAGRRLVQHWRVLQQWTMCKEKGGTRRSAVSVKTSIVRE
jgi:hypothetical protein